MKRDIYLFFSASVSLSHWSWEGNIQPSYIPGQNQGRKRRHLHKKKNKKKISDMSKIIRYPVFRLISSPGNSKKQWRLLLWELITVLLIIITRLGHTHTHTHIHTQRFIVADRSRAKWPLPLSKIQSIFHYSAKQTYRQTLETIHKQVNKLFQVYKLRENQSWTVRLLGSALSDASNWRFSACHSSEIPARCPSCMHTWPKAQISINTHRPSLQRTERRRNIRAYIHKYIIYIYL